jgi:hypothetical protein
MAYQNLGRQKLLGVWEALKDIATAESDPRMEGRMMGILLAPGKKKVKTPKQPSASKEAAAPVAPGGAEASRPSS